MLHRRKSGVLLHVSSLPSRHGAGDLGPGAKRFVRFLAASGQSVWQILPLNPTSLDNGNSPYSSHSAFACEPLLISLEELREPGWITRADLDALPPLRGEPKVDYRRVRAAKEPLLACAFERFRERRNRLDEYQKFARENSYWLDDHALFTSLSSRFRGTPWRRWPRELRERDSSALERVRGEMQESIEREKFLQFAFWIQWRSLVEDCHARGVQVLGDMPIYVNYHSADVWAHPGLFQLDRERRPRAVAGVPPDYFSRTGQLWGNPLYDWDAMRADDYRWWRERIRRNLRLFDAFRLDHFRGLVAYWRVPAGARTAQNGRWVEAPAKHFFRTLLRHFTHLPIIAEDLGVITPDVREVMQEFGFPGMRVLQFAFGGAPSESPHAPHAYVRNCVAYTGTHDNNTARGWFERELDARGRKQLFSYLGRRVPAREVNWELARMLMMSVADLAVLPMQDVLGLGESARMNRPATGTGNWEWRLEERQLIPGAAGRLRELTETYGRA